VQVQAPEECEHVEAILTPEQVRKVFTDHVPGVATFLFRQMPGQFSLQFLVTAYEDGFRAFQGTALHDHFKSLFRLIVHHGHEEKPCAAQYLTEVAEAFMDCQAVQARVVERVGLELHGITTNFRGLVTALLGEYKTMALKMLAVERIQQGKAYDDATPTHYENRLTEDLGEQLGLNAVDVRRAALDVHARSRFARLSSDEAASAATRCRELFDLQAFLQALVSELNSFNEASPPNSLPRLFLGWVSENMKEKHIVFDEECCSSVDVASTLVMAILKMIYLDGLDEDMMDLTYRGMKLRNVFNNSRADSSPPIVEQKQECGMAINNDEIEQKCESGWECSATVVLGEIDQNCMPGLAVLSKKKHNRRRPTQRERRANKRARKQQVMAKSQFSLDISRHEIYLKPCL
jgi:hypothetical protein